MSDVLIPGSLIPLVESIRTLVSTVSWLVGGIFGIYFILLVMRWWYSRRQVKLLKQIRHLLWLQNEHLGIRYEKKSLLKRYREYRAKKKKVKEQKLKKKKK